jgi:tetratricopeptide (TPR) repeat protein
LRWDDAHAAYSKALELRPDHVSVSLERAGLQARLGLWDLASADLGRAFQLHEPDTSLPWFQHALLRLHLGDADGYRQVCRRLRARFRGSRNGLFLREVVRACVLAPNGDTDPPGLVHLAQLNHAGNPKSWYRLYLLGIAQYRAGQHEEAIRRLRESLQGKPERPARALSYPVLAMAYHRLGQAAEARQALDTAAETLDRWTRDRYQAGDRKHWVSHQGAVPKWPVAWWDWVEFQLYYREARVLIAGTPPPTDPRLHVLRARAFAGLRWHAKAEVEFAAALKVRPEDAQVQFEAHRNRGYASVHRHQWREAATEFAQASALQPDDGHLWEFQAVAHLAAGDVGAYRQCCAAMMQHFEKSSPRGALAHVVDACVLRDDALPSMTRLVRLARAGSEQYGAALYRAGKYGEAVRCFEAQARTYRPRALGWCFLAMAQCRLGHNDEARRCLAEAARWIDAANREELDDAAGIRPAWGGWEERIKFPLLLREAEELLRKGSGNGIRSQRREST